MAGLINSAMQSQTSSSISDPLLAKTKSQIEARMPPAIQSQAMRIENAALELLSAGNMPQMVIQKIKSSQDPLATIGQGVANLIALVFNQVTQSMNPQQKQQFGTGFIAGAGGAAPAIMCQVLSLVESSLGMKITPDVIAQCTKDTADAVLQKFNVSNQQLVQMAAANNKRSA